MALHWRCRASRSTHPLTVGRRCNCAHGNGASGTCAIAVGQKSPKTALSASRGGTISQGRGAVRPEGCWCPSSSDAGTSSPPLVPAALGSPHSSIFPASDPRCAAHHGSQPSAPIFLAGPSSCSLYDVYAPFFQYATAALAAALSRGSLPRPEKAQESTPTTTSDRISTALLNTMDSPSMHMRRLGQNAAEDSAHKRLPSCSLTLPRQERP